MAMTNRERQAKWRAKASAAIRKESEYHPLFAEEVQRRAQQLQSRADLDAFAEQAEEFYRVGCARMGKIAEELGRSEWDQERADDAQRLQTSTEEALIDIAAAKQAKKLSSGIPS